MKPLAYGGGSHPNYPGVALCNGVLNSGGGGGFSMQWGDLRRIAEAA